MSAFFITNTANHKNRQNSPLKRNAEVQVSSLSPVRRNDNKKDILRNSHDLCLPFYFPILTSRRKKDHIDYSSPLFLMRYPERPKDKTKLINFRQNPALKKGTVIHSYNHKEIPLISASPKKGDVFSALKDDFNKMNYNSPVKIKIPKTHRSIIVKRNRYKNFSISELPPTFSTSQESLPIIKAKSIILNKVPSLKGMGYQGYSTERMIPKNDKIVNVQIN